jgi:hypothetical protein
MSFHNNDMVSQQVDAEWNVVQTKSKQYKPKPKPISDTPSRQNHTVQKTDEKSKVFLNMKKTVLDINDTRIHPKVYNYIAGLFYSHDDNEVIHRTITIGINHNDKIMAIAHLFFLCVRYDKISIMQRIFDNRILKKSDQQFIINAYDRNYTPIMRAAYHGSPKAFKLLLHWGANPNPINIKGETVFNAMDAGLNDILETKPLLEIFERPKFQEMRSYLERWYANAGIGEKTSIDTDIIIDVSVEINENTSISINLQILTLNDDIEDQIDIAIASSMEDYNIAKLSTLFSDIKCLLGNNYISRDAVNVIIDNYRDVLVEEFPEQYALLNA